MTKLLPLLIPASLILVIPLGVAGQNIGLGVALALFIYQCMFDRGIMLRSFLSSQLFKSFIVLWMMIVIPILISTLRHDQPKEASRLFWGYLFAAVIPVMGGVLAKKQMDRHLGRFFTGVILFCALVAASQMLWGWKIESGSIAGTIKRAQGFYSHPLTLAYVTLVGVPFAFFRAMSRRKNIESWILAASFSVLVCASQSVTVLALSGIVAIVSVATMTRGKVRLMFFSGVACTIFLLIATSNPVSHKIETVLSGQRGDSETGYPDDRMAFWHAHWEMFKDAPLLGHGAGLEKEDRAPYYERIGLPHITRKYEAHNMYLQYAVEGGIIPVVALLGLLSWLVLIAARAGGLQHWERAAYIATPVMFALGGLTQNAIQDSEVRFALLAYIGFLFWKLNQKSTPDC